jgi:hypothetical protein
VVAGAFWVAETGNLVTTIVTSGSGRDTEEVVGVGCSVLPGSSVGAAVLADTAGFGVQPVTINAAVIATIVQSAKRVIVGLESLEVMMLTFSV